MITSVVGANLAHVGNFLSDWYDVESDKNRKEDLLHCIKIIRETEAAYWQEKKNA